MKRLVSWLACAALVASLPAIGAAQETKKGEDASGKVSGVVASVTGTSLVVKGTEKGTPEGTFQIDDKTQVIGRGASTKTRESEAAGKKTTILDFVGTGDTVEVTYADMKGMKHARIVRVTKKAGT